MKQLLRIFFILGFISSFYSLSGAKDLKFGIVSKSIDDINFIDTVNGCQEEASRHGDVCVHIGPKGSASPRPQVEALQTAVKENKFAALAVSVVFSEGLAQVIKESVLVPVITFDSPFNEKNSHISKSYIGIDNIEFGRDLAKIVKKLKPCGGSVFLMGDMHDPNLSQRIYGVRQELSGKQEFPKDCQLKGEGGWKEFKRSPWRSGDNVERTMEELVYTFTFFKPDVFISVGHWPIVNPEKYRNTMQPFIDTLKKRKTIMVFGVGKVLPEYKSLLDDELVHGLVSINFKEIGKITYNTLKDVAAGKKVPEKIHIKNKIVMVGR